jgi:phosphatidate cytidylyltransferase
MAMLRNRLITALLLGSVFLGALYGLPDLPWALFLLLFIAIGAWEWAGLAGFGQTGRIIFVLLTAGSGGLLLSDMPWAGDAGMALLTVSTAFWLLLAPAWLTCRWRLAGLITSAVVGWLLLLPAWLALIQLRHVGPSVVLAVMATVWLADSTAYFAGKRFGRHKLAPEISPGKTWEGVAGAAVVVTLVAAGMCWWRGMSAWFVAGALAIVVLSIMGDLFESLIKRQAGKKDSGTLLPGHGGVLDRIDGLTSTLPLVAFVMYLPLYAARLFS